METSGTWGGVKYASNSARVWASVSGVDDAAGWKCSLLLPLGQTGRERLLGDLPLRARLSFEARASRLLSSFDLMSRSASKNARLATGMLYILSARLWKMGRPVVKFRAVPRPTWATLRGAAGGRGRRGAPMRTDKAWRTGRDQLLSILGIRDAADCMERTVPVPGEARSVPGVVRWPTKAFRRVLVLWRMREEKGVDGCCARAPPRGTKDGV